MCKDVNKLDIYLCFSLSAFCPFKTHSLLFLASSSPSSYRVCKLARTIPESTYTKDKTDFRTKFFRRVKRFRDIKSFFDSWPAINSVPPILQFGELVKCDTRPLSTVSTFTKKVFALQEEIPLPN
jgi:hypothetical protein